MKVGDLVRRISAWREWQRHNHWMTIEEVEEVGIIIEVIPEYEYDSGLTHHIAWPIAGLLWEDPNELELINGNR